MMRINNNTVHVLEDFKIYIMGPITGITNENIEAFRDMERKIKEIIPNCQVVVPHDLDAKINEDLKISLNEEDWNEYVWASYMKVCIPEVVSSNMLISLNGWEMSRGSRLEKNIADQLGIAIRLPFMALKVLSELKQKFIKKEVDYASI